jgi:type IV secretion system protein VirD4
MKNYAGNRLSPWLGHLMVSRQETARPLLTAGEVMQLPSADELVLVSGIPPIRAKKARYYEDRRLAARIMPPPSLGQGGLGGRPASRPCDWNHPPVPSPVHLVANGSAAVSRQEKTGDHANAGIRREPALPEHESVVFEQQSSREFVPTEDEPDDEPARAQVLRQRMNGVARQAAMDPDDGISL